MRDGIKIIRDPIYELVYFNKKEDAAILEIIDSAEFQRLRRIKQLGLSNFTYPSSNHDRFSHSIGVCFLAGLLVDNLDFESVDIKIEPDRTVTLDKKQTKLLIRLAAILHDIGHGPFSHAFERAIKKKVEEFVSPTMQIHEDYSIKILKSDPIKNIIENVDDQIISVYGVKLIEDILSGTLTEPKWIKDIISSQFDVDRIDYLLRDAYMCGVTYAAFDWQWIFHNMVIRDIHLGKEFLGKRIIIDGGKGIHSLESFVISRYHMYEQVYFHKTTRGFEAIVNSIFKRLSHLIDTGTISSNDFLGDYFLEFLKDYTSISNYLQLDDQYMTVHFHHWAKNSKDCILKNLCLAFVNRKPFKLAMSVTNKSENLSETFKTHYDMVEKYKKTLGESFDYYFLEDGYTDNPYRDPYLLSKSAASDRIWLDIDGKPKDLAEKSIVINALRNSVLEVNRIYVNRDFYIP